MLMWWLKIGIVMKYNITYRWAKIDIQLTNSMFAMYERWHSKDCNGSKLTSHIIYFCIWMFKIFRLISDLNFYSFLVIRVNLFRMICNSFWPMQRGKHSSLTETPKRANPWDQGHFMFIHFYSLQVILCSFIFTVYRSFFVHSFFTVYRSFYVHSFLQFTGHFIVIHFYSLQVIL